MEKKKSVRMIVTALLALSLVSIPAQGLAASDAGHAASDAGMGVAAVFTNIFYIPAKVCYAVLGGVTGGLAFVVTGGNSDVANQIWVPSLGGDYVLTPSKLQGDEPIFFSGLSEREQAARKAEKDIERASSKPAPAPAPGSGGF